jgi:hypothetical protein
MATFTLGVRGATLERFGAIYLSSSNATLTRFKPDPLRDREKRVMSRKDAIGQRQSQIICQVTSLQLNGVKR